MLKRARGNFRRWLATRPGVVRPRSKASSIAQAKRAVALHRCVGGVSLARSLAIQARVLGYAERGEEAMAAARESIELADGDDVALGWAHLALADAAHAQQRYEDGHAAALLSAASFHRLSRFVEEGYAHFCAGASLVGLNRHSDAVAALEAARRLLRRHELRTAIRSTTRALQTDSLLVQEYRLTDRIDEAIAVGEPARDYLNTLVRLSPQTYRPQRAILLTRLATCHQQASDAAAAAADFQLATADFRAIAGTDAQLGWCLGRLADQLRLLGRLAEADAASAEGLAVFERMTSPDHIDWLDALAARTDQLWLTDRKSEAADVIADRMDRLLAGAAAPCSNPRVAEMLRIMALRLAKDARPAVSVPLAEAAVAVARRAADDPAPGASHPLAQSLDDLGAVLRMADRLDDALDAWDDATDLLQALADAEPKTYDRALYDVLLEVAQQLYLADRDNDAMKPAHRAIEVARRLDDRALSVALLVRANVLSARHDHEAAAEGFATFVRLRRSTFDTDAPADRRDFVRALRGRAYDLAAIRRPDEARADLDVALVLGRQCYADEPAKGVDLMLNVLRLAARVAAQTERLDDVVEALRELSGLVRSHPSDPRQRLEVAAFAAALHEAPDGLPAAWATATGQPYPGPPEP